MIPITIIERYCRMVRGYNIVMKDGKPLLKYRTTTLYKNGNFTAIASDYVSTEAASMFKYMLETSEEDFFKDVKTLEKAGIPVEFRITIPDYREAGVPIKMGRVIVFCNLKEAIKNIDIISKRIKREKEEVLEIIQEIRNTDRERLVADRDTYTIYIDDLQKSIEDNEKSIEEYKAKIRDLDNKLILYNINSNNTNMDFIKNVNINHVWANGSNIYVEIREQKQKFVIDGTRYESVCPPGRFKINTSANYVEVLFLGDYLNVAGYRPFNYGNIHNNSNGDMSYSEICFGNQKSLVKKLVEQRDFEKLIPLLINWMTVLRDGKGYYGIMPHVLGALVTGNLYKYVNRKRTPVTIESYEKENNIKIKTGNSGSCIIVEIIRGD